MPSFFAGAFAIAGAMAAAAPVAIHLLNRRRFRVVEWAAMDFLREAVQRSRRMLQLRDLLLLALRTACVLLFGLAMARPYFSLSGTAAGLGQPVHAVLVVDNSLSMAYQRLDGTVLDEAKAKARDFIERLPAGSQISLVPLCSSPAEFSWDPYRTKEDALEALQAIRTVDREGSAALAVDLALQASQRAAELPAKRVVLVGDQQRINWPAQALESQLKQLADVQVVQVGDARPENAWIADFRLQDGIADVETPTVFLATVRYDGPAPRPGVQVTLAVDGVPVASQTIDLEPGQAREVTFPYRFEVAAEPGRPAYSTAAVSIPADRLSVDDERVLVVPVVAALPVVFVDQYGGDEDPTKNRYGETFRLRRLLAPVTSRGDSGRQLIQVRHVKIDDLDQDLLQDARLVVIAGIENPGPAVRLLRDYVEQGGQLVIGAGGQFDPAAWNSLAWSDGAGILPAPLQPQFIGVSPEEAPDQLQPFYLDVATLVHDYFRIDRAADEELTDLYRQPIFFKAIAADMRPATLDALAAKEAERIARRRLPPDAASSGSAAPTPAAASWLLWAAPRTTSDDDLSPEELAERTRPRVLAGFTNRWPFLVERSIGRGQVLLMTSGLQSDWNTLTTTNAVLMFDRIFRGMLQRTLPERNLATVAQTLLPVEPHDRRNRFSLLRPKRPQEPLAVDALGGEAYGITIRDLADRGIYRVIAERSEATSEPAEDKLWELPVAANGPQQESELTPLDRAGLAERTPGAELRWIARDEPISLDGAQVRGQNLWKWLMSIVLVCLVVELVVLSWSHVGRGNTT
jgi:aerotolerance regulator-like protein/VWA domain-containing protein